MIGKKIGVQSVNDAVWAAFLKANNIAASKVNKVSVSFDPTPLTQGQVDGWFSFITNEPIELGLKGIKTKTFLLADYNYPEVGNVFIATTDSLQELPGQGQGGHDRRDHRLAGVHHRTPTRRPRSPCQKYGQGLTLPAEQQQSVAQNKLIAAGDAPDHGLFYIAPATQAANVKTLALGGTTVTASQLFDMSILDEIYQARPDLKTVPTPGTI